MSALLVADRDGRYIEANDEALALFGVTLDELCRSRIGDFSGPHAQMGLAVWRRLAAAGTPMPTGESTVYRRDGTQLRVRYTRIAARPDGCYDLELEALDPGLPAGPPVADRPSQVLEAWRAAERDAEAGGGMVAISGAKGLRELYHHTMAGRRKAESGEGER